jgi:ParB/RepB/Spo0J family partition protein
MKNPEPRIREIALDDIDRSRNHRIPQPSDAEELDRLKASIEACGGQPLQPVRVYERGEDQKDPKHKEKYILGYGNRRCKAMEQLGKKAIWAIIFPPASNATIAAARGVENIHRKNLAPMEEVQAVADILEAIKEDATFTGDPYEEAAARIGCSEVAWVKDRDYLHRLSKPVQKFALRSALPLGHLRELSKIGDPQDQMRLACEAAGAPARAFPFDPKDAKLEPWQKQMQDQFFAEVTDGKSDRWPLSVVKEQVAKVLLSLKVIPWAFDQPLEFGAVKLRACAGCPHNSETDRLLFELKEDTGNPNGYCHHASCFNAKHGAVDAAKEHIFKKIKDKEDQTPTAIKKIAPGWMKESTVVGHVKRQLEKAARPPAAESKTRTASNVREFTEHEKALREFADSFHAWEQKAWKAVFKAINADPSHRVSWCVLLGVPAMWDHPRMQIPMVQLYAPEQTAEPELPPLSAELESAVKTAFAGTRAAWIEILTPHEQIHPDSRGGFGIPHPRILELLASEMKVKLSKTPKWTPPVSSNVVLMEAEKLIQHDQILS